MADLVDGKLGTEASYEVDFTDDNLEDKIHDIYNKLELIHNKINRYLYSK